MTLAFSSGVLWIESTSARGIKGGGVSRYDGLCVNESGRGYECVSFTT